jgi:hypothetical protein
MRHTSCFQMPLAPVPQDRGYVPFSHRVRPSAGSTRVSWIERPRPLGGPDVALGAPVACSNDSVRHGPEFGITRMLSLPRGALWNPSASWSFSGQDSRSRPQLEAGESSLLATRQRCQGCPSVGDTPCPPRQLRVWVECQGVWPLQPRSGYPS